MTQYFAVWASDRPGRLDVRLRVREAHRARLRDPTPHAVTVLLGGPALDAGGTMNGTLLIVEAETLAAVQAFVDADPYHLHGVYGQVEIRPWLWGLGRPAAAEGPGARQNRRST